MKKKKPRQLAHHGREGEDKKITYGTKKQAQSREV